MADMKQHVSKVLSLFLMTTGAISIINFIRIQVQIHLKKKEIENLRKRAGSTSLLSEDNLRIKDPLELFDEWMKEAMYNRHVPEPCAMCLATVSRDGRPSARFMLLTRNQTGGFQFFTNNESPKAKDLNETPMACAVVYWHYLNRSIRITGTVTQMSDEDSEKFFCSRPKSSQIGSWVSAQSSPVRSRDYLVQRQNEFVELYKNCAVPRPPHWSGYTLNPINMEFWQGQNNYLHDRLRFFKTANNERVDGYLSHRGVNGWSYQRLSP